VRLGWCVHLIRPFFVSGTIWRSKRRGHRTVFHGKLPDGWRCPHDHRRDDTAIECARREDRRRNTLRSEVEK
jgi:hypothetical protein